MSIVDWFADPQNWTGSGGIPAQVLIHLIYSGIALGIAVVIGLPIGLYVGHTGRGRVVVAGMANALRALPSLGLLILAVMIISPVISSRLAYVIPSIIVLVLLAVPPILTNTYAGVQSVDDGAVDAARGMGYTRWQILLHVQIPGALPLIMSGIRSSTLQVVSTATIAAFVSLGGLGRFILDGRASQNYSEMAAGAILVALLAILLEVALIAATRLIVSPGLTRSARRSPRVALAEEPATH
ncbi:ABC transporter permease [Microbacterium sp. cx-55]|uniref:ABC transporter permease n=1 Tax=Microbacterium sp. cx-55 TaxID=2875948 RepID=UPI001CBAA830|nr:ABC transporter permease [Microbacterium sp. cx-55]MBZ4487123.1 ABC transporter permease [Microbacterium sp. cx-55]UGB35159.1 ABC transporter permease [Microbacterium sp. cx-55]